MVTKEEYLAKEREFMLMTDALCEDSSPAEVDCNKCPAQELCKWLHDNCYVLEVKK